MLLFWPYMLNGFIGATDGLSVISSKLSANGKLIHFLSICHPTPRPFLLISSSSLARSHILFLLVLLFLLMSFSSPSTLFHFFFSPYSLSNPPSPFNPLFIYWWVFVTKIVFMKDRVSVCKCTEILVLNWSSLLFVLKDLSLCLVKNSQRQTRGGEGGRFEIQGTSHLYNSLFNIHF